MKFDTAFKKLRELAKGEYCNLSYAVYQHSTQNSKMIVEIKCYIDNFSYTHGHCNFTAALKEMKDIVYPKLEKQELNPEINEEEKKQ